MDDSNSTIQYRESIEQETKKDFVLKGKEADQEKKQEFNTILRKREWRKGK